MAAKWKFSVLALILAAQTSALGGGSLAFDSLFHTRDHYYSTLNFADLRFQFDAATPDEMPSLQQLREIPGVSAVSRRFNAFAYIEQGTDHRPLPVVVHYLDPERRPAVDNIQILDGSFLSPEDRDGAILERSFAQAHGLSIGDTFVVDPGRFPAKFRVIGIGLSPEYLMPTANPEVLIPNRGSLGVVFASTQKLQELFADPLYNELSFKFQPGTDRRKTTQAVTQALHGLHIERAMPLESNFGFRYVENILGGSRIFMPMTALLLAAMAAIVAIVIVSRLIADRRREIGALMAQGFSARGFVAALLLLGLVPATVGALLGIPGAMLFAKSLAQTNASVAGLPDPIMIYPAGPLAIAVVAAIGVGVASVLVSSALLLRVGPGRLLRSHAGASTAPSTIASWLAELSSAITFRYAVRNVSRRWGLSTSSVLLVALAIAMPAGMLTAMSSWDSWAREKAAHLGWDAAVAFKARVSAASARSTLEVQGIRSIEPWLQGYATLSRVGSAPKEMRVVGIPVPASLQALEPQTGRSFQAPDAAEIIFNTSFLRGMQPPALGEVVTLSFGGRSQRLTVVGLVSDAVISTVFVPIGTAQRLFDQPGLYSGAYVAFAKPVPGSASMPASAETRRATAKSLESTILARENVGAVQLKVDVEQAMIVYLQGFSAVVVPFIFLAGLLGFLFLLSVLSLVIAERDLEYATLRSMGYATREISGIVLTELAVLVIAGLGASGFAWLQLSMALRDLMARAWFWIPISLRSIDYAFVSLPVLVFLMAASVPAIRWLLRSDLSEVLRRRALG